MLITCLKSEVTRARATWMFTGAFRELRRGRLRAVIDFYIPYHLFRVTIGNCRATTDSVFAMDAVTGKLDPYQFEQPPATEHLLLIKTPYCAPTRLDGEQALALLKERLMRMVFLKGFFKLSKIQISGELIASWYMPYWVGVYERHHRVHLEVIDAVRGKFEGAKLREIVTDWFRVRTT